ncbi:unnamed protein product [Cuscuta europaea]|uniref:Uncharacterized protein n=1 Tax=Cuscuta europaea TaxID=41803 RepID=A0A9P0ZKU6_CUSEU|nr:unnamed protein product [Cuscuta europaea]
MTDDRHLNIELDCFYKHCLNVLAFNFKKCLIFYSKEWQEYYLGSLEGQKYDCYFSGQKVTRVRFSLFPCAIPILSAPSPYKLKLSSAPFLLPTESSPSLSLFFSPPLIDNALRRHIPIEPPLLFLHFSVRFWER